MGALKLLSLGIIPCIVVLDQVTKTLVLSTVSLSQSLPITSFFNITLLFNRGISFGFFQANDYWGRMILIGIVVGLTILLLFLWGRSLLIGEWFGYSLVIGGAIGNVIDRYSYGGVVDFLDFHVFGYHWPAFNIADSAIVVGVGLVALSQFINSYDHFDQKD
ncbi:MAG: signal peptidase II [Alphaproteobacteria bacterium]|nr:signal peptidase II [Alphaproteobacteria bacterium]